MVKRTYRARRRPMSRRPYRKTYSRPYRKRYTRKTYRRTLGLKKYEHYLTGREVRNLDGVTNGANDPLQVYLRAKVPNVANYSFFSFDVRNILDILRANTLAFQTASSSVVPVSVTFYQELKGGIAPMVFASRSEGGTHWVINDAYERVITKRRIFRNYSAQTLEETVDGNYKNQDFILGFPQRPNEVPAYRAKLNIYYRINNIRSENTATK